MTKSPKYQEQFERVKRWYEEIKKTDQGRPHDRSTDYYQDEVYAFFFNCYHLKDWIKNDKSVGAVAKKKVEDFINNSKELSLCADICNSSKHLVLTHPSRSKKNPQFGKRKFYVQLQGFIGFNKRKSKQKLSGSEPTISIKYEINTSKGLVDAFELATKCLQKWEEFIKLYIK